ncbi:MAG: two-component regulator propeller domain-containing protein [Bacteroidota bacterium]
MRQGLFSLFLVMSICGESAQVPFFPFKQLNSDDGLSQNAATCLLQDRYGFLWIGTQDGLNRYDGRQFVQYRSERGNPNSLSNNYIWTIYEDANGILWIGTFGGGLNRLNPLTGDLQHFHTNPNDSLGFPSDRVFSILEYPEGTLWLGCNEGLVQFDKATGKSTIFFTKPTPENDLQDNFVGTITKDQTNQLWLRTDDGLTRFNPQTQGFDFFTTTPFSGDLELGDIYRLLSQDGKLLVTCDAGLLEIDPEAEQDQLLFSVRHEIFQGQAVELSSIWLLGNGQYALGSNLGFLLFDRKQNTLTRFVHDAEDPSSLSHNNVISLYRTHDEVLWIGTRNGLNILEQLRPDFLHIPYRDVEYGLSTKYVNSFMEENDSLLWVGTKDGLNLYHRKNHRFKVFNSGIGPAKALRSNYLLCLFKDSQGRRWMGTRRDGFYQIIGEVDNYQITRIQPKNVPELSASVHCIIEAQDGTLWIGTGGEGLWQYDPEANTMVQYPYNPDGTGPSHTYVFTILEDSQQNLWLGTATGGLNLFDRKAERFQYFRHQADRDSSLSDNLILHLYEDQSNHLWIATSHGLNKLIPPIQPDLFHKLDPQDPLFKNFGKPDGLPNEVIYGMVEDPSNRLWLSTNRGLAVFHSIGDSSVINYDVSHGLQNNEFNQNGFLKDSNGIFFFGGVNGFNIFHPDSIQGNPFPPTTVLTDFSLYNRKVATGTTNAVEGFELDQAIHAQDAIKLKWKHDVITIDYAGLSFQSPEKNQYRYRLLGFKDEWVEAGNRTAVTYTNLDPGAYTFEVLAANNSGVWSSSPTQLQVHVGAPPWATWYAYFLYGLVAVGLFFALLRYRTQQATRALQVQNEIEKARTQEREQFRKRSSRDFHDEAGTKITRIALVTELLKNQIDPNSEALTYLGQIEDNLQQLNTGMRDFIWALDPEKDNIQDTILRFTEFASPFCEYAGIQFLSEYNPEELPQWPLNMAQRRHTLLILKEGLHNAIKHAQATEISFQVKHQSKQLELILKDNGIGYDPNEISSRGNGLKNMQERAESAGIQFQTNTQKGQGTALYLHFQTTQVGD